MCELRIADTITRMRYGKGITQEQLAEYMGVSKAAVSKWEKKQSYPDITLLPRLSAYFDISIDELIGYRPQMTTGEIRKLYAELVEEFGTKSFESVKTRCNKIAKKYSSCYPLLFQLGVIFTNYGLTAANDNELNELSELKTATLTEAKELFIRVKTESDNIELRQIALYYEATCEMMLKKPDMTIDLLKDVTPVPPIEELLAQAYLMKGKAKEAKTELQKCIYNNTMGTLYAFATYLAGSADQPEQFDKIYKRAIALIEVFNLEELAPTFTLPIHFNAAQGYMALGNSEKALDALETYTEIATGDIYPLKLFKNDDFFTLIDDSVQQATFGVTELPRDEKSIKQGMASEVIENLAYAALFEEPRFKRLVEKLKHNIEN